MSKYNNRTTKRSLGEPKGRQLIYMITIRKHQVKDYVSISDLRDVVIWLKCRLPFIKIDNVVYEIDSTYRQLHLHCILRSPLDFKYNQHTKCWGYRIHYRKVYDLSGARGYLSKQVSNIYEQQELLLDNYYSHHYGFAKQYTINDSVNRTHY